MTTVEGDNTVYDGVDQSYIPPDEFDKDAELDIADSLSLHTEMAVDIDPVTYEVIRHSLFSLNRQHGSTIQNLAASNIVTETRDFQTTIVRENGDYVLFGPYALTHAGQLDLSVKWTLENRSESPGIEPGDMFIHNDPWVATTHQMDVILMAPVFHDGELFCWVSNVMHHPDMGGSVPGSWCQDADDRFQDPPFIPPTKVVEGGELQEDAADLLPRFSRLPRNVSLDMRSAIAGNNEARENIKELIDKYGADTVKAAMDQIQYQASSITGEKLSKIPDGEWHARAMHEVANSGDRATYKIEGQLVKEGDELTFTAHRSDDHTGALSITWSSWRSAILSILVTNLIPEQLGAADGIVDHVDVIPEPDSLLTPPSIAAVSAGTYGMVLGTHLAHRLISQMLLSSQDEDIRNMAATPEVAQWNFPTIEGTNQKGDYFINNMSEQTLGSDKATPYRDGEFANGWVHIPDGIGPNVEAYERDLPVLYMFRREHKDSAGHGYRRGGSGLEMAVVSHKSEDWELSSYLNEVVPKCIGIYGGGPGSRSQTQIGRETRIRDLLADDELPDDFANMGGTTEHLPGKGTGVNLGDDDVLYVGFSGIGGYADPLEREPERVAADAQAGTISEGTASENYGVVLAEDGTVDEAATEDRRQAIRQARLDKATADFTVEE